MTEPYSVLMSVYASEKPAFFARAAESMLNQTAPPAEFVIVCDGPLTEELDQVIERLKKSRPGLFKIIRFRENKGLGKALRAGVKACSYRLIARMDSDDISLPSRCETQLARFRARPELALLSAAVREFETKGHKYRKGRRRQVPVSYGEILKFAKKRNPMNHMAVMMDKYAALDAGNYRDMPGAEDYDLWVRMLAKGSYAENAEQVLVLARAGAGMIRRRGGILYAKHAVRLQREFLDLHFINRREFMRNCFVRVTVSLLPGGIRKILYERTLRDTGAGCRRNTGSKEDKR